MKKRHGFEMIARVALRRKGDGYTATPIAWGEDGIPGLLLNTDGFLNIPLEVDVLEADTEVEVELLKSPELIRSE